MQKYNHKKIEAKWQKIWEEKNCFAAANDSKKPKFYALIEFPYPSGQGLHVGHPRSYTALDIIARKRRMQGYNVLYPIGWDAFGLPAENFAIKNKIHPAIITSKNIANFKRQLKSLGLSFDWSREINTTDPSYYRWTQWIFLKMFEKGLAYKSKSAVNWCTSCRCVLANEEVISGKCERCSSEVTRREKSQWMLKITAYAKRLADDLDLVDYPERVKIQQRNWIGESKGVEIDFNTTCCENLQVFTTRPDTIFGVTYMVISPEHPLLNTHINFIKNINEIEKYKEKSAKKSDLERTELAKEKTGIKINGIEAIHPITGEKLPIFVSDYVLMSYGTGAIMAVPAHDARDKEFAEKFNLPIKVVIENEKAVNSDFLNDLSIEKSKEKAIEFFEKTGQGKAKTNFKLRDWVFSRQRYWGEPIPIVKCEKCGFVALPESELPLKLPEVESFEPGEDGESPLAKIDSWVNTTCPKCGEMAHRETDTMPQWAGSSWYFLRYCDPHNEKAFASKDALNYWLPIDWYNGGMEHTTLHLLYSRFWYKFLYDLGVVPTSEPYAKRTSHGLILGENGEKMSKSKGNVVNPDEIIDAFGADTMRLYEMFIGDFEQPAPWSDASIKGCHRFLERFWGLSDILDKSWQISQNLEISLNKTIKKVTEDVENLKFNTALAALMTFINEVYDEGKINIETMQIFTVLLSIFAPHIAEEVWRELDLGKGLACQQNWPVFCIEKCKDQEIELVVQINGKVRTKIKTCPDMLENDVFNLIENDETVQKYIADKAIIKRVFVPNRLVNLVVK